MSLNPAERFRISNFEFRIFGIASGNGPRSPEVPGIPIRRESACLASSRGSASRDRKHGRRLGDGHGLLNDLPFVDIEENRGVVDLGAADSGVNADQAGVFD